jgi:hypothetical protein
MENFLDVNNREPTPILRGRQEEGDGRVGRCWASREGTVEADMLVARLGKHFGRVGGAVLVGAHWATSGPRVREASEGQVGPAVSFQPKAKTLNISSSSSSFIFHTFL